ncbi:MAG: GNAT family N-acetyltransferase [Planctomycetota bacterium]
MKRIERGDLTDPRVIALVNHHVSTARGETGLGCAHALETTDLDRPGITFWTIWDDASPVDILAGIGALKELSPGHGEIKSMHTAEHVRRRGFGRALLDHIIAHAKANGMSQLSLETGSWDYFEPARRFYRRHGFVECEPFADYRPDPNSVFMSRELSMG